MSEITLYFKDILCNDANNVPGIHNISVNITYREEFTEKELKLLSEVALFYIDLNRINLIRKKENFFNRKDVQELNQKVSNIFFNIDDKPP